MLSIFGDLERFLSEDLYPYRWPIVIGLALTAAAVAWFAYRRGWHQFILRYPVQSAAIAVVAIAVLAYPVYYTGSPLFSGGKTICEASPITGASAGSERCEGVAQAAEEPSAAPSDETQAPTEAPSGGGEATAVAQGEFEGADDFHFGRGQALLIQTGANEHTLRFENFEVRNGPDLFVYLSTEADGYSDDALELGELKGTKGAFNYEVPVGTDVSQYKSAVVWCKDFGVLFAVAPLAGE